MIFIDFDDTIYNTKLFKKQYFKIFQKHEISKELFDQTYYSENNENGGMIYVLEDHIERIEKVTGMNVDSLRKDIKKFLINTSQFVFDDFFSFAKTMKNKKIILLSYGMQPFQGIKIKTSKISKYFAWVIVTKGKKSSIVQAIISQNNYTGKIFFLDDRPDQLEDITKNIKNIVPIRVKRKEGRYRNLPPNNGRTKQVSNLDLAANYIINITRENVDS